MQRIFLTIMILGMILVLTPARGMAASIDVLLPEGGDHWAVGEDHTIKWGTNVSLTLFQSHGRIELVGPLSSPHSQNGPATEIAAGQYNAVHQCPGNDQALLCWDWHIQDSQVANEGFYRIRVSTTYPHTFTNQSAPFIITDTPFSLSITSPSAGDIWQVREHHAVKWAASGSLGITGIELLGPDSYPTVLLAADHVDEIHQCGSFYCWDWHIRKNQVPKGGTYRIRLRAYFGNNSNNYFTSTSYPFKIKKKIHLEPGSLSEAPHAGLPTGQDLETAGGAILQHPHLFSVKPNQPLPWHPGENHSVRWQSFGISGKVKIFLVRGQTVAALLNANRHEWSPPGGVVNTGYWRHNLPDNIPPHTHYRVLVESVDNPGIKGLSNFFPIRMRLHAGVVATRMKKHLDRHPAGSNLQLAHKPALKPGKKPPVVLKKLWLQSPHGMETWYIGKTYPVTWQASGITGRVRVVLVDRHGKKRTINGMTGTEVNKGLFSWKIGSDIKPGSMYTIYLVTTDDKIKSTPSGGFNIKMEVNPSAAKKALDKKTKPHLKAPAAGVHRNLQ